MIDLRIFGLLAPVAFGAIGFSYLQTIGDIKEDIAKMSNSVDTMLNKLESGMEKKIDAVDDDVSRLFLTGNSNLNDLENELEGKFARLEAQLDKLTSDLTRSKSDTQSEKVSTEAIKGEVDAVKNNVDAVDGKVDAVDGKVVVVKDEVGLVKGEVEKVQDEVKDIATDIDDTSKAIRIVKNALINSFSDNKELLRQLTDERLSDLRPAEFFSNEPTVGAALPDMQSYFEERPLQDEEAYDLDVSGRKSIADYCRLQNRSGMSVLRCYDNFLKRYEQIQIGEMDEH